MTNGKHRALKQLAEFTVREQAEVVAELLTKEMKRVGIATRRSMLGLDELAVAIKSLMPVLRCVLRYGHSLYMVRGRVWTKSRRPRCWGLYMTPGRVEVYEP